MWPQESSSDALMAAEAVSTSPLTPMVLSPAAIARGGNGHVDCRTSLEVLTCSSVLRGRIQDLARLGRVSSRDAAVQLQQLELGDETASAKVAAWLRERGAAQAAFRTGFAAQGTTTSVLVRSACGAAEAHVELEGEHVGSNGFFSNLLSNHWSAGSCVTVSQRWLPFCPTLLRFLHSPQPLFVDQLMYQQTLESALALHHCALYFLAAGEFFLEFFHIVHARQHLLVQGLEQDSSEGALLFPPDPSGECFDIYHLPLQGVLMWLVALELPAQEAVRVLRQVDGLGNSEEEGSEQAAREEVDASLQTLFSPNQECWRGVIHGTSGMGLSEVAEAEERERRQSNLACLHDLAMRLRSDMVGTLDLCTPSAGRSPLQGDDKKQPSPGAILAQEGCSFTFTVELEFGRYLEGVKGFCELCAALAIRPDGLDALALAFCCGSADAQSLSSRQGFVHALASQCCSSISALQVLLRAMVERVRSPDVAPEFWDWLFRALSSISIEGPSSGQNAESAIVGAGRACKKLRLYERPSLAISVAAPALHTAASCLGSPPLLPRLAEFLLRHESRLASVSRDTWQMTRVFLQRFPNAGSLGNYDEGDGEFPCLLDSFVEEIRRECGTAANNGLPPATASAGGATTAGVGATPRPRKATADLAGR